jgi:putative transcriptional regulator
MSRLQGHLLVASPKLADPNFRRTVVLIVRHDEEGALGLVLNRPTNASIREAWKQLSKLPCHSDEMIRLGGPCEGPLMALHTDEDSSEFEVRPGIYFSAQPEHIEKLVAAQDIGIRFFACYAGWGAGQLEQELEAGAWATTPARPEHVFGDDDDMWNGLRRSVGAASLASMLEIKHIPADPRLN